MKANDRVILIKNIPRSPWPQPFQEHRISVGTQGYILEPGKYKDVFWVLFDNIENKVFSDNRIAVNIKEIKLL